MALEVAELFGVGGFQGSRALGFYGSLAVFGFRALGALSREDANGSQHALHFASCQAWPAGLCMNRCTRCLPRIRGQHHSTLNPQPETLNPKP